MKNVKSIFVAVFLLISNICIFSQELTSEYLDINKSGITRIDAIKSETYKYQIYWEHPNFRYDWLTPYNIQYVFIDNQKDYDFIRYGSAQFIDFNKYVLFAGNFKFNSCDNAFSLSVYYDNDNKINYLCFNVVTKLHSLPWCQTEQKTITFLIPRKYYNDTRIIYFNKFHM